MNLNELYSNRTDFTIIGLTGRIGSGCTSVAKILSKGFNEIERSLRKVDDFNNEIFRRKYEICLNYLKYKNNWHPFTIIEYKKVLFLYIVNQIGTNKNLLLELLKSNFNLKKDSFEKNEQDILNAYREVNYLFERNSNLILSINKIFSKGYDIRTKKNLGSLHDVFFDNKFDLLYKDFFQILENIDYLKRAKFLHITAYNIRSSNSCFEQKKSTDNIYILVNLINTLIKSLKIFNKKNKKPTKIVIDSLKNSFEILYFKERFSAFYMISTKDITDTSKVRINIRLKHKIKDDNKRFEIVRELLELDETEYKTNDFTLGNFSSPDLENCIQKSEYHIFHLRKSSINNYINKISKVYNLTQIEKDNIKNRFLSIEEQLIKLIALISQPGLITPSSIERSMQIAYTAKLNSGCISRQVGACITDEKYYIKTIGWNDIAAGQTPCNLRTVNDYLENSLDVKYSDFEKGKTNDNTSYKYKNIKPFNFKDGLVSYFEDSYDKNKDDLNGKNCPFCFKTIHNYYEGESNQVHTRSLHAEENAMLQITKFGGIGVKDGILFTTASPCELCSKKAYQLGIKYIYYIDPYPGIAIEQILKAGNNKPLLLPFSGAIGNTYHKLYEQYMSSKDEITLRLEMFDKVQNKNINQFKNLLRKIYTDKDDFIDKINNEGQIKNIIDIGLGQIDEYK